MGHPGSLATTEVVVWAFVGWMTVLCLFSKKKPYL